MGFCLPRENCWNHRTKTDIVKPDQHKKNAIDIWNFGVKKVIGKNAVKQALQQQSLTEIKNILAVGKAADSMLSGCADLLSEQTRILLVTKYDHAGKIAGCTNIEVIESGHPVPDQNSLNAGKSALEFVRSIPPDEALMIMVSGSSSARRKHFSLSFSMSLILYFFFSSRAVLMPILLPPKIIKCLTSDLTLPESCKI